MATILVVDDEYHNRLLILTVLSPAGHTILQAGTGEEALRVAQDAALDLVIVDLSLPDMTGTEVIRTLRADPQMKNIRMALYTASPMTGATADFMEMMDIRVTISKPAEPEEIVRLTDVALRS